jgi:NADPH:quinone reductase-like Zn-dependent oxidoreductase
VKAALVNDFSQPPTYGDIDAPQPLSSEYLISTRAVAISQLVRAKASGKHYSSAAIFPQVPGVDGVGQLADGRRVFFAFPRGAIGSMAQYVAIAKSLCVSIPEAVDDVTAAAIGNPGMSSVAALEYRARFKPGESILINGAAGASGRLAIQIAKYMGASRVIATARNRAAEPELLALGADVFICLQQEEKELTSAFHDAMRSFNIDIVLDYLWGAPAACILNAISNHDSNATQKCLRFVNIGSAAGASIPLNAGTLRSNTIELTGSGLGSVSPENLVQSIGKLLQWVKPAGLRIAVKSMPLEQVKEAWRQTGQERIVLTC